MTMCTCEVCGYHFDYNQGTMVDENKYIEVSNHPKYCNWIMFPKHPNKFTCKYICYKCVGEMYESNDLLFVEHSIIPEQYLGIKIPSICRTNGYIYNRVNELDIEKKKLLNILEQRSNSVNVSH